MTQLSSSLQSLQIDAGEVCYAGINAVLAERVNRCTLIHTVQLIVWIVYW